MGYVIYLAVMNRKPIVRKLTDLIFVVYSKKY